MSDIPPPVSSALPPIPQGWRAIRYALLDGGRLAIIGANVDLRRAWQSDREGRTVGEMSRLVAHGAAKVWTVQADDLIENVQFPLVDPFPIVDQFLDGRWLVANARSQALGNARILTASGDEIRRIELGDGIQHIKIDDQQRVWVGWFDEGVFGNDHWRIPGLKRPPSGHGMAAFDEHGTMLKHATLRSVADCYALNVFASEAWACTYTDFPIWQMSDERECTWSTSLSGVSAIAVSYPYVLAAGGYREDFNRVVLLRLDGADARPMGEWRMPFRTGDPAEVSMMDGRGDELHVVSDDQWRRWRVREFVKFCS